MSFTIYYLEGNGQDEFTNKVLWTLLTKLVNENKTNWDEHLSTMLFSYKTATWYKPYQLMYGLHLLMPKKYKVPINGEMNEIVFQ
jgi:hypothetical protein